MKRSTIVIFLAALVVLVIFGGGVYLLKPSLVYRILGVSNRPTQRSITNAYIDQGRKLVQSGNPDQAVPALEKAVQNATDTTQEYSAKLVLASAYITSSNVATRAKGVSLFKEISLRADYPGMVRSNAANSAVEYYLSSKDVSFAQKNIFTGPTWSDFMNGNTFDSVGLEKGVISALEWTSTLALSFSPEYTLAYYYGEQIGNDKTSKYIHMVKDRIQRGDLAYAAALQVNADFSTKNPTGGLPPYTNNRLGIGLEHKALALVDLYKVGQADLTFEEIAKEYTDSIALLEKDPNDKMARVSALYNRFHLAVFYVDESPTKYKSQITTALAPLYKDDLKSSNFYTGYLKSYGTNPALANSQIWKDMVKLGRADVQFKALLLSVGWNESAFKE